ncbi:transcriptional regulator with XRE-family HTH domain/tetratricopeptide (TPR) repeat protein [Saccharothrix tamanrassetensis]|uniref:Transcriptional regulator with XRE-family HTH domain/tetratricopeptide (TPR) repeat protein n=1 Tax=Saccharothrix tamanrassetensis TaxID=1051531 RepID=A0A841CIK4_9PSEU|nr:helix-turn-helix domain-containing protein [Saccharothrix tamanrassetensis]MBB5956028.1 transcriptional regulator with XRE-family HTH domain/tetratricopeptide (TPR) repeat protein [Saccharothrix tamanrassetensis]
MGTRFGDLLRGHRRRAKLTQEELAAGSGVSIRAISDMERGRARGPQRRTVEALAGVLALTPEELHALASAAKEGRARRQPVVGTPCALPPDVTDLTGREPALRALAEAAGTTPVIVVHGPPGAGKTSLAVRAGYRFAERFPDGRFFFDLRGMDSRPVHPVEVVHRVLSALGVEDPPAGEAERSDLYRELLRERSTLIVLDNAADEAQVRPLLATGKGSLVLITSRQVLGGLAAVARLGLDVLGPAESVELLGVIAGPDRVAAEREAARQVAALCGHLPLALRIAGNRLAGRPKWTVRYLADKLADERRRLSALTAGDLQVRTAFEMSYRQLGAKAALLFRRLSLVPGASWTPELAAVAADVDRFTAEDTLEELVDMSLLDSAETPGRYAFHDLLRVFAGERLVDEEPDHEEVRRRLVGRLIGTAVTAAGFFGPDARDTPAGSLRGREDADAWLTAETSNWLGGLRWAAGHGMHREVLDVATAVHWYSDQRGRGETWVEVFTAGVAAARALGSVRDEAVQLNFLTWTLCVLLRRPREALALHGEAWSAATASGDVKEQAWAMHYRAASELRSGDLASAKESAGRAQALFRRAGYVLGEQISLSCLGLVLHGLRQYDEAVEVHRRLLANVRSGVLELAPVMAEEMQASLLVRTADSLAELGRWSEVFEAATEALRHSVAATAPSSTCDSRHLRGLALCRLGDLVQARAELVEAAELLVEHRHHRLASVLDVLAEVHGDLGDPDAAGECRSRAAELRSADR